MVVVSPDGSSDVIDSRVPKSLTGAGVQPHGGRVAASVNVDTASRRLCETAEAGRDETGRRWAGGVVERVEREGLHVDVVATRLERV